MEPLYIYKVGPVTCDYDEFDSFVVMARSEDEARELAFKETQQVYHEGQVSFKTAQVHTLGIAQSEVEPCVVLGSFNAG